MRDISIIQSILNIESPTFREADCFEWVNTWIDTHIPELSEHYQSGLSCIRSNGYNEANPTLAFVGHLDVVPSHFTCHIQGDNLYGAGASDMKAAIGCFLMVLKDRCHELMKTMNIQLILYSSEEGTALKDNGLNHLILAHKNKMEQIDCALIGEPTNLEVQLGCVGSLHTHVTIHGESAHSARPWDGKNALYEALSFIDYFSKIEPKYHMIEGCKYADVIQITESQSEQGRTTIPGVWSANLNFRFSPVHSEDDARQILTHHIEQATSATIKVKELDCVPAGKILNSSLSQQLIAQLQRPVTAKQAWTDVAQFSSLGVPAFNFGPGLTSQAHKPDEYIPLSNIEIYCQLLEKVLDYKKI